MCTASIHTTVTEEERMKGESVSDIISSICLFCVAVIFRQFNALHKQTADHTLWMAKTGLALYLRFFVSFRCKFFIYSNLTIKSHSIQLMQQHHWTHPPRFTCAELFWAARQVTIQRHCYECSRMWCRWQVCLCSKVIPIIRSGSKVRPFLWVSILFFLFRNAKVQLIKIKYTQKKSSENSIKIVVRIEWIFVAWNWANLFFFFCFSFAFEKCDTECDVRFWEK